VKESGQERGSRDFEGVQIVNSRILTKRHERGGEWGGGHMGRSRIVGVVLGRRTLNTSFIHPSCEEPVLGKREEARPT